MQILPFVHSAFAQTPPPHSTTPKSPKMTYVCILINVYNNPEGTILYISVLIGKKFMCPRVPVVLSLLENRLLSAHALGNWCKN